MVPLTAAVVAYPFLPAGQVRDLAFQAIALVAVLAAFAGFLRHGSGRPAGWLWVLCGYLGWVLGDPGHPLGFHVADTDSYPGPADAVHLASYGLVACGLLMMVRRRGEPRDRTAVLDLAVLATGLAFVAVVFIVTPIVRDSALSLAATVMSSAAPLAAVLVLCILVRLWTRPGAKPEAFSLLSASLALTLAGNVLYDYARVDPTFARRS